MARQTSIAEARDKLSLLVNAVAHGHARIVLTSRGRPKAALVGLDDLAAIEGLDAFPEPSEGSFQELDALAVRIVQRRGALLPDSSDDLAALREGAER